ncbi:MAG: ATP phosphoribosyltransferase [Chloroflexota bacterium]
MTETFTLALPSKGAIAEPTHNFLRDAGLKVHKPNPRQYTGSIPAIPGLNVLFQRVKDVVYKVADGTAQIGITGYDVVEEHPSEDLIVIHDALGYGHCALMVAVPEAWIDVESMADLVDVALDFREGKQRNLRVATTYTNLTRRYFHASGIHHFTLVKAEGAIEAAPTIGYADIVVDLSQTGTTLRENHLRPLPDGVIVESQACLIGNRRALIENPALLDRVRVMLEYIDGALHGRGYSQLTVNIRGESAEEVGQRVVTSPVTAGLLGPTIAPIYSANGSSQPDERWFTVTITVRTRDLLAAVDHLRAIGGRQIVAQPVNYVFLEDSPTFRDLLDRLGMRQP